VLHIMGDDSEQLVPIQLPAIRFGIGPKVWPEEYGARYVLGTGESPPGKGP
jgi:hypothetical protein